ncbi:MAG TPA: hypothetical protein VKU60_10740, partial [Chloroflexota bacterium]|nr:hypothetical protein [Chloroflexota bacterium]
MENVTEPVTRPVIEAALDSAGTPVNWQQPAGIQTLPAYHSALPYSTMGPPVTTDIFPSWYKPKSSNGQSQVIDKVSGNLATNCTPALAKETLGGNNATINEYSIDQFYPPGHTAGSSNVTATDNVHNCGDSPPTVNITASDCNSSCTISATPFDGTNADGSDRPLNEAAYPQYPATVTIAVNGATICTNANISSGVPVQCPYSPTFSGSGTITASVTDSVLYQGSDSATVNFTQAQAGPQNFTGSHTAGHTNFSWSGGVAPYTVYNAGTTTPVPGCSNVSGTSCQGPGGLSGTFYVQDNDGNKSNTASL